MVRRPAPYRLCLAPLVAALAWTMPARAQDHRHTPGMTMPEAPAPRSTTPTPPENGGEQHDEHDAMPGMAMENRGSHSGMAMPAAFGP